MPYCSYTLRCCTTARYIPPYHLGSTILTQQPYRFKSILRSKAELAESYADKHSKQLPPFYPGQPIATFDTLRKIWIPTTVVHVIPKNSYQVCTANGTIYCYTKCHLWECSVRYNDADPKAPSATSEQAHTRFPRPVPQPATTIQWTPQSVASVTPEPNPAVPVSTPTAMPNVIPSAYTHLYTECSTCATMKVRLCLNSTKMPDHKDVTEEVTAPGSMNNALDP